MPPDIKCLIKSVLCFNAPRTRVWAAWTERAQLMQWFGPKGFTIPVCNLDLREGGTFHYCMRNADGVEMWGRWAFLEIFAPEKLVLLQSFSDPDGGVARSPFGADWPMQTVSTTTFTETDGKTTMKLHSTPYNAKPNEITAFTNMQIGRAHV